MGRSVADTCERKLQLWEGWTAALADGSARASADGRYGAAAFAESASIGGACLHALPQGSDVVAVAAELYRVLKPGGKVLAVVRARYDVDFWWRDWLPWGRLLRPTSLVAPADPHRFSARSLRRH